MAITPPRKTRKDATIEALPAAARQMLWVNLGGEQVADMDSGRPAKWKLGDAVEWLKAKHKIAVSETALSKWYRRRAAFELIEHQIRVQTEAQLAWVESHGSELDMGEVVDMHVVSALSRVIGGENSMDEAARFLASLAAVKRVDLDKDKLRQRVREYEESTEKLRAELTALRDAIKAGKLGKVKEADLRAQVVAAVDRVMGLTVPVGGRGGSAGAAGSGQG